MSSTPQWFMAIGGQQVGPVSEQDVIAAIQGGSADGDTLVFVSGMADWTPLKGVAKFQPHLRGASAAVAAAPVPGSGPVVTRSAHEIDYTIHGEDLQFVEVELDPGESVVAEAGALMYMTGGIEMQTIFGDGSAQSQGGGLMGALLGRGQAPAHGREPVHDVSSPPAAGAKEQVAFAAPYPGRILAMDLAQLGGELICQKDSFLCAARGRLDRHRVPEEDRRRPVRRRRLHHAAPAGRRLHLRARGRHAP